MPPLWPCSEDLRKTYSPNLVEGEFCELRLYRVLRSSLPVSNAQATPKIRHMEDAPGASCLLTWRCCTTRRGLFTPPLLRKEGARSSRLGGMRARTSWVRK